tara:strand:+ start:373 stop:672 length:300 start_codon:yes stop_codon:yes gene_type:complete
MPPTEKYTKCDIINGYPWYINMKQNSAKQITIGKKKAIYYRTRLRNGKTRKNYLDKKCRRIGTSRFWNYINNFKEFNTNNARGLTKKKRRKQTRRLKRK